MKERDIFMQKMCFQICVICITLAVFGVGMYGAVLLENNFNVLDYLRDSSYQRQFYDAMAIYYPSNGARVQVYVGKKLYYLYLVKD